MRNELDMPDTKPTTSFNFLLTAAQLIENNQSIANEVFHLIKQNKEAKDSITTLNDKLKAKLHTQYAESDEDTSQHGPINRQQDREQEGMAQTIYDNLVKIAQKTDTHNDNFKDWIDDKNTTNANKLELLKKLQNFLNKTLSSLNEKVDHRNSSTPSPAGGQISTPSPAPYGDGDRPRSAPLPPRTEILPLQVVPRSSSETITGSRGDPEGYKKPSPKQGY
jgi:ABC-type transporter Mla subunit MlaD